MINLVIDWIKNNYGTPPLSAIFILIVALVLAIIYSVAQLLLIDTNKARIYSARIKKWREKYKKAMKSGNPRLISEVQKEKEIIDRLQLDLTRETFKPMMVTFFLFFGIYYVIISTYGRATTLALPFLLPFSWLGPLYIGPQYYLTYNDSWISGISAFTWYILTSIVISSIINTLLKILGYRPY